MSLSVLPHVVPCEAKSWCCIECAPLDGRSQTQDVIPAVQWTSAWTGVGIVSILLDTARLGSSESLGRNDFDIF